MPEEEHFRPWVQVAVICQAAISEANGVLSIIRVTDRIGVQGITPEMQPFPLQTFTLAVLLKSGFMKGKHVVKVMMETPSGERNQIGESTALFEGEDRGVAMVTPLPIVIPVDGLYWFDLFLEEELLTRIPLRVIYQRIPTQAVMGPPPGH